MISFLLRRSGLGLLAIVGASMVIFALTNILPGDVVLEAVLGGVSGGRVPQETIDAMRHQLGHDKPIVAQYWDWIRKIGAGEFGYSFIYKDTVGHVLGPRMTPTIHIAIQAVVLSWFLGLPLGLISALRRNSVIDHFSRFVSVLGLSLPFFWIGALVVWVMATKFGWFPPLEYVPPWRNPWISTTQTIAPSVSIAIGLMAYISRMSRSTLLEVLREDYIRTARAKGLAERTVIWRHAMKLALLPVLTLSAVGLGRVLGGSVVVETVFGINGLGRATIDAVIRHDISIVQNP